MKKRGITLLSLASMALVSLAGVGGIIASSVNDSKEGVVVGHLSDEERDFVLANPTKPFYTPTDQYYSSKQYVSHKHVGDIETVWDSYRGSGTKIAVIDTGINYKHPDFKKDDGTTSILPESKYYYTSGSSVLNKSAATYGYDVLLHDWDSDYSEWDAHGTNSAGCAAARTGDGVGTIGIAPEADLLIYKTDMYLSSISYAIKDAVLQGADVINMSLGAYAETFKDGYGDTQSGSSSTATYLQNIINYAHNNGVIVIAAAGNEKTDHHSYPACNTHVIGVGALNSNSSTTAASFSNFNYTTETDASGDHNVDVVAPGYVYTPNEGGTQSSPDYSAYCNTQGTSFSSPIVAGAAALWKQKNPNGTPDEFMEDLYASCVDIGTSGFDYKYGNGRLDVKALLSVDGFDRVVLADSEKTIYTGSDHAVTLETTVATGTITWSSSDTKVATVNSSGKVTGIKAGTCTITAKVGEATATCAITVKQYVAATSISLVASSATIEAGNTYQIQASILPANASDPTILYESLSPSVASVDDNGKVTGLKAGTADIYMMGPDDTEATFSLTVTAGSDKTYRKLTTTPADWTGDYLFVYEGSSTSYAFNGGLDALDATSNTIEVTPVNGAIASNATTNAAKFTVTASSNSGYYNIKSASGQYIGGTADANTIRTGTNPSGFDCQLSFVSGHPVIKNNTYLTYNASSGQTRFRFMKTDNNNIHMYKLGDGTFERPAKELSSISVSYTGGDVYLDGSIDESKITVTATYTYPTYYPSETVTGWTLSGFSSSTTGNKTVTVAYGGKTATFTVNVVEDPSSPLTSIEVTGVPTSLIYRSSFSKTGIKVTAHYARKSDADVTSSVTLPTIDTTILGDGTYTVSYTENGITKSASVTYKVTNQDAKPTTTGGTSTWNLVSADTDLAVGDKVVIVASNAAVAMSTTQNDNNRGTATITKNSTTKTVTINSSVQQFTLVSGKVSWTYAFSTDEGYLYAASSSKNYLRTSTSLTNDSSFTVSFSSTNAVITAQGSATHNIIRYNSNSPACFSCYASGQNAVLLYKLNSTGGTSSWTGEEQAKSYAAYFISQTNAGCSDKSASSLSAVWTALKNEFGYMIDDAKDAFISSSDETIAEARERYKIIVSNYGLDAFVSDSSGNKLTANQIASPLSFGENENMVIGVIALFALGSAISLLMLKKKHN